MPTRVMEPWWMRLLDRVITSSKTVSMTASLRTVNNERLRTSNFLSNQGKQTDKWIKSLKLNGILSKSKHRLCRSESLQRINKKIKEMEALMPDLWLSPKNHGIQKNEWGVLKKKTTGWFSAQPTNSCSTIRSRRPNLMWAWSKIQALTRQPRQLSKLAQAL